MAYKFDFLYFVIFQVYFIYSSGFHGSQAVLNTTSNKKWKNKSNHKALAGQWVVQVWGAKLDCTVHIHSILQKKKIKNKLIHEYKQQGDVNQSIESMVQNMLTDQR